MEALDRFPSAVAVTVTVPSFVPVIIKSSEFISSNTTSPSPLALHVTFRSDVPVEYSTKVKYFDCPVYKSTVALLRSFKFFSNVFFTTLTRATCLPHFALMSKVPPPAPTLTDAVQYPLASVTVSFDSKPALAPPIDHVTV